MTRLSYFRAFRARAAQIWLVGTVGAALHSSSGSNLPLRTAWSSCDLESRVPVKTLRKGRIQRILTHGGPSYA